MTYSQSLQPLGKVTDSASVIPPAYSKTLTEAAGAVGTVLPLTLTAAGTFSTKCDSEPGSGSATCSVSVGVFPRTPGFWTQPQWQPFWCAHRFSYENVCIQTVSCLPAR